MVKSLLRASISFISAPTTNNKQQIEIYQTLKIKITMKSIDSLNSFLNILEGKNEEKEKEKQILLLVRPSFEQYVDTISSLYKYLEYPISENIKMTELKSGVLNYTYTKSSSNDNNRTIVEVYTIFNPTKKNFDTDQQLINILQKYSSKINALIFINCAIDEITNQVNSIDNDDSIPESQFIKDYIIPILHKKIDPFFNIIPISEWKSCNIIISNVSKWSYRSTSVQIIDFIQQFLRSLLHYQYTSDTYKSRNGFLAYFPFDISDDSIKTIQIWNQLLSETKTSSIMEEKEDNLIKYNDIFFKANQDSLRKITILDDSFQYSDWLSIWNESSNE